MKKRPTISVLTPVYNCAHYITRCIESVQSQGYGNVEHIIADGGSKDGTVDILKRYPHLVWISEPDSGEAHALNKAIRMASGDLLVWLNGDDWLEPGAFEAVISSIELHPNSEVLYGKVRMVHEANQNAFIKSPLNSIGTPELIRWWLTDNHPHQPGMYFSREALLKAGLFDESLHYSIDYEYWLRLARDSKFGYVDSVLANALIRVECKSAGTEVEQVRSHWNVLLPYVRALPPIEQEHFWRDYYQHRLSKPMIFEQTRMPEDDAALGGLVASLTETPGPSLTERFSKIFPGEGAQAHVTAALEDYAARRGAHRAPAKKVKVAEDYAGSMDLTKIAQESDFARGIREVFSKHRPTKIIETGTYLGTGTTAVIASTLRDLGLRNSRFFTIEVNPNNVAQAHRNLDAAGLSDYVQVYHGLSVPRSALPTVQEIEDSCVRNIEFDDIFVDHREHNRAALYYQETNFDGVEEDLLGKALEAFGNRPDFVILDSAGHMGFVEFSYLLKKLQGPCVIALDDVYHIKHHKSFAMLKGDPRFKVVVESREKFGFCIAEFTPDTARQAVQVEAVASPSATIALPREVSRVLLVRTDAIGDNILASSLVEPLTRYYPGAEFAIVCEARVAPLYHSSPLITKVFSYELVTNDSLDQLAVECKTWKPDLVINSAYSRYTLSDLISSWFPTVPRIAFEGDTLNTLQGFETAGNGVYTSLVKGVDQWMPELHKYGVFLESMGISAGNLKPVAWRDPAAEAFADDVFKQINVPRERAVAFAPGARVDFRTYERFAETLAMLAEAGYVIIGLGTAHDEVLFRRSAVGIQLAHVPLFGKTTLPQSAAIIARCGLLIGTESAPAHLACAVGTPNVVILGGGHFGRFMPYSPLTSAVSLPVTCAGCNWVCRYESPVCVKDIDPVVVRQAVEDRLAHPIKERPQIYMSLPHIAQRGLRMYPSVEPDVEKFSELGDVIIIREGEPPRRIQRERQSRFAEQALSLLNPH
jgi:ADP-heptose:LPS heptosyltransferase/glycosyltransferase involved in cell wall biosynthesis/predicted O-methyltransferase YrrM